MQVLLRNPLAEPYILGSSGGAAVAALIVMSIGAGSILVDAAGQIRWIDQAEDYRIRGDEKRVVQALSLLETPSA